MAYTYERLTVEKRQAVIDQRIEDAEAEHWVHEVNKITLLALPVGEQRDALLAQAHEAQAPIEAAIAALKAVNLA